MRFFYVNSMVPYCFYTSTIFLRELFLLVVMLYGFACMEIWCNKKEMKLDGESERAQA